MARPSLRRPRQDHGIASLRLRRGSCPHLRGRFHEVRHQLALVGHAEQLLGDAVAHTPGFQGALGFAINSWECNNIIYTQSLVFGPVGSLLVGSLAGRAFPRRYLEA